MWKHIYNILFVRKWYYWVGLYTAGPESNDEVTASDYKRQYVLFHIDTWKGTLRSDDYIVWPTAIQDWGVIKSMGLFISPTIQEPAWSGWLFENMPIYTGDRVRLRVNIADMNDYD